MRTWLKLQMNRYIIHCEAHCDYTCLALGQLPQIIQIEPARGEGETIGKEQLFRALIGVFISGPLINNQSMFFHNMCTNSYVFLFL